LYVSRDVGVLQLSILAQTLALILCLLVVDASEG
jgi:hypothetical protein